MYVTIDTSNEIIIINMDAVECIAQRDNAVLISYKSGKVARTIFDDFDSAENCVSDIINKVLPEGDY